MDQPERIFRKRFSAIVGCGGFVLLALLCAAPAFPQAAATAPNVPSLPYKAVPNFFATPPGDYLGESQGVATNSKGDIFVFFRGTPGSRLWEFDNTGKFVREIGKGYYGFLFAHMVRVDSQDNIWTVDEGTNVITKFSPDGSKILMVLGHRPSVMDGVVATRHGPNPPDEKYTFCRPTDVAWDQQGDIFVADGYCNNRVMKYDRDGRFLAQVGGAAAGKELGKFNLPHALQVDHEGNVYVADRGNNRYVVLDNNLKPKTAYTNVGTAWTDCISQGPHQYLFGSNSNPNGNGPGTWQKTGQIYKMELDGTVLGKFGYAGKLAPGFQVVHAIDCRNPDQLFVGEIESWRVQKFVLQPK
jgi:DNA-binding beta-propeller fold protein YncE